MSLDLPTEIETERWAEKRFLDHDGQTGRTLPKEECRLASQICASVRWYLELSSSKLAVERPGVEFEVSLK